MAKRILISRPDRRRKGPLKLGRQKFQSIEQAGEKSLGGPGFSLGFSPFDIRIYRTYIISEALSPYTECEAAQKGATFRIPSSQPSHYSDQT